MMEVPLSPGQSTCFLKPKSNILIPVSRHELAETPPHCSPYLPAVFLPGFLHGHASLCREPPSSPPCCPMSGTLGDKKHLLWVREEHLLWVHLLARLSSVAPLRSPAMGVDSVQPTVLTSWEPPCGCIIFNLL